MLCIFIIFCQKLLKTCYWWIRSLNLVYLRDMKLFGFIVRKYWSALCCHDTFSHQIFGQACFGPNEDFLPELAYAIACILNIHLLFLQYLIRDLTQSILNQYYYKVFFIPSKIYISITVNREKLWIKNKYLSSLIIIIILK